MPRPAKGNGQRPQAAYQDEHIASTNETARAFLGGRQPSWMTGVGSSVPARRASNSSASHSTQTSHNPNRVLEHACSSTSPRESSVPADSGEAFKSGRQPSSINLTGILPSPALSGESSPDLSTLVLARDRGSSGEVTKEVRQLSSFSGEHPMPQDVDLHRMSNGSLPSRGAEDVAWSPSDQRLEHQATASTTSVITKPSQQPSAGSSVSQSTLHPRLSKIVTASGAPTPSNSSALSVSSKRTASDAALSCEGAELGNANVTQDIDRQQKRLRGLDQSPAAVPPETPICLASVHIDRRWGQAIKNRIQNYHNPQSGTQSAEMQRYQLLYNACSSNDTFFVLLHQAFCLWSVNRQNAYRLLKLPQSVVDAAFGILSQILRDNMVLSAEHLSWFAMFPIGPERLSELMPQQYLQMTWYHIVVFLRVFADHWQPLVAQTHHRRYPLQVWELNLALKCPSSVLQLSLFTCSRRMLGVAEGQIALELQRMHIAEREAEASLSENDPGLRPARLEMARRYRYMTDQATGYRPPASAVRANVSVPRPVQSAASSPYQNTQVYLHWGQPVTVGQTPHVHSHTPAYASEPQFTPAQRPGGSAAIYPQLAHAAQSTARSAPTQARATDQTTGLTHGFQWPDARQAPNTLMSTWPRSATAPMSVAVLPMQQDSSTGNPAKPHHAGGQFFGGNFVPPPSTIPAVSSHTYIQSQHLPPATAGASSHPNGQSVMRGQPIMQPQRPLGSAGVYRHAPTPSQHENIRLQEHEMPRDETQCIRNGLHLPFLRSPQRRPLEPCGQRFFQFLSGFAVPPKLLPPQKGLRQLTFSISEMEFSQVVKIDRSGAFPVSGYHLGSLRYRLRMCKQDRAISEIKAGRWANCSGFWPQHIFLTLNDQSLQPRRRQHFQHDLPIELCEELRLGENTLQISLPNVAVNTDDRYSYFIGVEIVTTLDHPAIQKMVREKAHISRDETILDIQRRLKSVECDDLVVQGDHIYVSVTDPFSSSLFHTPVRGVDCKHLECFDLDIWLHSRPRKLSQDNDEPCLADCWKCPICGLDARPTSLRLDDYFAEIQRALVQRGGTTTKRIKIRPDGSWEALKEPKEPDKMQSLASTDRETGFQSRQVAAPHIASQTIVILDDD